MTSHTRRAFRLAATLVGVAALGATFSGTAFAADHDDTHDGGASPAGGYQFHHDHHGATQVYDYDLYNPAEHYDENKCKSKGADRHPLGATVGGIGGFNGDSAADCKVDSGDYHPKRTGYRGTDRNGDDGYSGYVGGDGKRQAENHFLFKLPGS